MDPIATFGPYTILRAIAATPHTVSFAARYEGRPEQAFVLSLKAVRPEVTEDPAFVDQLAEELGLAVRLNHVNIAQTFDFGLHGGVHYIALEFVDGLPLATVVGAAQRGRRAVTTEVAVFVCAEMCAGLAYAHGRRDERGHPLDIIHTDVGPHSVLLSKSGLVKVVDFGLARALSGAREDTAAAEHQLQFMAPELASGAEADYRADIFSVGATAHLLLTGRHIYEGATGDALFEKAQRGYVPDIRDTEPSIPDELAELVNKALSGSPDDRFDDATDLRKELAAWLRRHSPGFGRHRLKNYLNRLVPEATYGLLPDVEWTTLHRKDFRPFDPDSLLATRTEDADHIPAFKDPLAPLLVDPDLPDLGGLDLTRMTTGAHPTVTDQARAEAFDRGRRPERAAAPASSEEKPAGSDDAGAGDGEVFAARSYLEEGADTGLPDVADGAPAAQRLAQTATETSEPAAPSYEEAIDPDELAAAVYDDAVDPVDQRIAMTEENERVGGGVSWIGVLMGLVLLGGVGYGVWTVLLQNAQPSVTPVTEQARSLFVTSRPQGAEILLNGAPTGLSTPAPVDGLANETVSISVRLAGFESPDAQSAAPTTDALRFELQPEPHTIRVDTTPPGANVIMDGGVAGVTPTTLGPLRRDYRQGVELVLQLDGFLDEPVSVSWEAGAGQTAVQRALQPDPTYVPPEE